MNTTTNINQNLPIFLSEIALLSHAKLNILRFRLSPHIDEREMGNPLSFHLSRKFAEIMVVWHQGDFYAIAKPNHNIPTTAAWREALDAIHNEQKDFGDRPFSVQVVNSDEIALEVLAQLAYQILKISRPYLPSDNTIPKITDKLKDINILMNSSQILNTLEHIYSLAPLPNV